MLTIDAYVGRCFAADIADWLTGGVYVVAVRCRRKMEDQKMKDRGVKYCRNCVWSESGWCEIYQQPLKPCAGKCLAFLTKHVRKRKTK